MDKVLEDQEVAEAISSAFALINYIKSNQLDYPCLGDDLLEFINEQAASRMKSATPSTVNKE